MSGVDEVRAAPPGEDVRGAGATGVPAARGQAAAGAPSARRRRYRRWAWPGVALVAAGVGYALAAPSDPAAPPPLGPGEVTVQIEVEHSAFEPTELRVVEGTRVRFVVVNGDPINHELIVGPPEVHARHAGGTESEHPSVPGEVSVGPNGTAITTFRFDEPGSIEFACHLPGHHEYGMHGRVEVVAAE